MSKYNIGQPFLLVADPRTGGTFLAHCLSSHPDVYCYRAEVLHRRDIPREIMRDVSAKNIVRVFVEQQGWEACGVKLVYKELREPIITWAQDEGVKIIHLVRENAVRVALSRILAAAQRHGQNLNYPTWRMEKGSPSGKYEVEPQQVIELARRYVAETQGITDLLRDSGLDVHRVTYAEMVGGEGSETHYMERPAGDALCEFLGVRVRRLSTRMYKAGTRYLHEVVANWKPVRLHIVSSELAYCLEDEIGDDELEAGEGPEPGAESGDREPDPAGSGEPRPDETSPGDHDDVGPQYSPMALVG